MCTAMNKFFGSHGNKNWNVTASSHADSQTCGNPKKAISSDSGWGRQRSILRLKQKETDIELEASSPTRQAPHSREGRMDNIDSTLVPNPGSTRKLRKEGRGM